MPSYRAKEEGFYDGNTYGPNRKRQIVVTEKPLKPVPSWLELIDEKAKDKATREAKEKADHDAAAAAKKQAGKDVKDVNFINGPSGSGVETLT